MLMIDWLRYGAIDKIDFYRENHFCVLSTEKAKSLGIKMPPIDNKRIEKIMKSYARNLRFRLFLGIV